MKTKKLFFQLFFFVAAATLVLDQLTKFLADSLGKTIHNTGSAFGLNFGGAIPILLSIVAIGIIFYYRKPILKSKMLAILSALILGGAVGNLIDRIAFGFVRDFINLKIWPAFNVADAGLTIGVIGLIGYSWMKNKPRAQR